MDNDDPYKVPGYRRDFNEVTAIVEPDEITLEFINKLQADEIRKKVDKELELLRRFPDF